jgi:hypothetical protein
VVPEFDDDFHSRDHREGIPNHLPG